MELLTVPNWSFGRNRALHQHFVDVLETAPVRTYFCEGDVDHNRTVTAFSGTPNDVYDTLLKLADLAFDCIDLNHHIGEHPRIGALDVCPIVLMPSDQSVDAGIAAEDLVNRFSKEIAERYEVPVFLYEKSEKGRHALDLPSLRKAGFGGLLDQVLEPDYGPPRTHQRLGVSVVGVRDFLIAMNVNLAEPSGGVAKTLAKKIRGMRKEVPMFTGVRAKGFVLRSRHQSQVSLNLTQPGLTPIDPIIEWVQHHAELANAAVSCTELIGVIRPYDLEHATRLEYKQEQIVE